MADALDTFHAPDAPHTPDAPTRPRDHLDEYLDSPPPGFGRGAAAVGERLATRVGGEAPLVNPDVPPEGAPTSDTTGALSGGATVPGAAQVNADLDRAAAQRGRAYFRRVPGVGGDVPSGE